MRVDDQEGPYVTKEECFLRSSVIIQDLSSKLPLLKVQSGCATQPPHILFKDKEKKEKEEIGPDNSVLAPDCSSNRFNCSSS
tara:strand:+ start:1735 stop:1980 length:246 start_codon:yes stop_codon:yes gene_type:complete